MLNSGCFYYHQVSFLCGLINECYIQGTTLEPGFTNYFDPGIHSQLPIFNIQPQCPPRTTFSFSFGQCPLKFQKEVRCVQRLSLWRNNSIEVNHEIFKGYQKGNHEDIINEVTAVSDSISLYFHLLISLAYDFLDTDRNNFNVSIWYNSTYKTKLLERYVKLVRVPRLVNLVSNAYPQYLLGPGTNSLFEFVKEMSKLETTLHVDVASLIGPLFFTWVILLLFPFSEYVSQGRRDGMKWKDFSASGMDEVFYIVIVEWFLALISAYYLDRGSLSAKDSFFFLKNPFNKSTSLQRPSLQKQGSPFP
ncbi:unnamed protein product [Arabis nemorensis]|uniref:Uncharacterized protein n=1 Tax=Arabis nemorensis TaxID=586526 RepID=A0A565BSZ9_9BRAS|nr:unnamed protein product [Arabis nemorensis]